MLFITSNKLKYEACKKVIPSIERKELDLVEIQASSPIEVALDKAKTAFSYFHEPLIINDCSFCIPALNNFPGVYASYIESTLGYDNLFNLMKTKTDRSCYYLDILVYIDNYTYKVFTAKTLGHIATDYVEGDYFPYDKLFIKDGETKPICFTKNNMYENTCYLELKKYLEKRKVSRGITFFDDKVLLLYRRRKENDKYLEYYAIPGGGIENETYENACIRELKEETSIDAKIIKYLKCEEYETGICYYYLTKYISGDIKLGGEELEHNSPDNYYETRLVPIKDLDNIFIYGIGKELIKEVFKSLN